MLPRREATSLLVVYLAVVGFIVFWPTSEVATDSVARIWSVLARWGAPDAVSPAVVEFATNVLLFVPLSFLGASLRPGWRWPAWLLVGLTVSATIEIFQLVVLPGRSAILADVVANTLGAVVGYVPVVLYRRS